MKRQKRAEKRVRTPAQERAVKTVEAILTATAQVLAARGYTRTTTNHIARKAGVSIASFYEYFADKDAAIRMVAEQLLDRTIATSISWGKLAVAHAPREVLREAVRQVVAKVAQDGPLFRSLQEVPFVWRMPKVEDFLLRLSTLARAHAAGQSLLPAEQVTDERVNFLAVLATSFIVQVATNPLLERHHHSLIDEFILLLDCYHEGILARAARPANARDGSQELLSSAST
jgi:AcrR family transcriptional regulator